MAEDLKIVADKVHDYQENYDRQFEQCRDYVKKFSGGSVEMMVAGGIANAAKGLGKLIGSAPILKDGPVDEWLQNSQKALLLSRKQAAKFLKAASEMWMS